MPLKSLEIKTILIFSYERIRFLQLWSWVVVELDEAWVEVTVEAVVDDWIVVGGTYVSGIRQHTSGVHVSSHSLVFLLNIRPFGHSWTIPNLFASHCIHFVQVFDPNAGTFWPMKGQNIWIPTSGSAEVEIAKTKNAPNFIFIKWLWLWNHLTDFLYDDYVIVSKIKIVDFNWSQLDSQG